ncbi:MAG: chaperone NapD [Aeromonas sp.]
MSQEFHVSSLVVLVKPSRRHAIAEAIAQLAGAEVHAVSEEGKLVVTLEGQGSRPIMAAIDAINALSGVISASLIYHQFEPDEAPIARDDAPAVPCVPPFASKEKL